MRMERTIQFFQSLTIEDEMNSTNPSIEEKASFPRVFGKIESIKMLHFVGAFARERRNLVLHGFDVA